MSQRKSDVLNILLSYDLSRSLERCASSRLNSMIPNINVVT